MCHQSLGLGWLTGKKCDVPNLVCGGEQGFGEIDRMGLNSELRGKKMEKNLHVMMCIIISCAKWQIIIIF